MHHDINLKCTRYSSLPGLSLPRSTIIEDETGVGRPDEISLLDPDEWPDRTLKKF